MIPDTLSRIGLACALIAASRSLVRPSWRKTRRSPMPQRGAARAKLVRTGDALADAVGEVLTHVMQRKIRVRMEGDVA
jgi:hypothetical protein